ncbi:MAG: BamA/TamA family outer membrane protein [Myxococcaceae bacterium]
MGLLIFLFLFSVSAWSYQVQVIGARAFRVGALKERILSKLNQNQTEVRQLEQIRFQILGLYRKVGFIDAKLEWKKPNPNQIICQITEGKQILVRDIQVTGAQNFSNDFLKKKILDFVKEEPLEPGLITYDNLEINSILNPSRQNKKKDDWVFFDHEFLPFNKSLFLKAKESLEEFYLDNGFLEVRIFGPKESEIRLNHWINLQFRIEEGSQTRVGEIRFEGGGSNIEEPPLKVGDPLNLNLVEDFRVQLEESFWNQGYPNAEIASQVDQDRVTYRINLGNRVKIENIQISGNQVTQEQVILSRFKIKIGDWFSLEKLTESRSRILQTDLFSEVDIMLDETTLLVNVKERERNTFEMGFGASFVDGPRIAGIWQHRNIFGRGISFRTRAQLNYPAVFYDVPLFYPASVRAALKEQTSNYLEGRLSAGFLYPKMPWVPFDVDGSIDFNAERDLQPAYILNRASSLISFLTQATSSLRITPQLELEYAQFDCPTCNTGVAIPIRLDKGIVKQVTPRVLMLWDRRDSALLPKKGYAIELDADFGFGDFESSPIAYTKLLAGLTTYVPLVNKLTWVMNTKAGGILDLRDGAYIPLFKRYYLGGTNSVRGFSDDQIYAVDATEKTLVSLGGNYFVMLRNEIRFPIVGDLKGGVFVDAGELMREIQNFSFSKVAVGTGFGIRYDTPIGPLMFDIGLRVLDGDRINGTSFIDRFCLHFSIGNSI